MTYYDGRELVAFRGQDADCRSSCPPALGRELSPGTRSSPGDRLVGDPAGASKTRSRWTRCGPGRGPDQAVPNQSAVFRLQRSPEIPPAPHRARGAAQGPGRITAAQTAAIREAPVKVTRRSPLTELAACVATALA